MSPPTSARLRQASLYCRTLRGYPAPGDHVPLRSWLLYRYRARAVMGSAIDAMEAMEAEQGA